MEIADNNEVHPIGIDFYPREKANQTHSQSYVEDLQALSGQKRHAKMAQLNGSMLSSLYYTIKILPHTRKRSPARSCVFVCAYTSIAAYRSLPSTCSIYSYGVMRPSTTMEKMLGLHPETSVTPCSFILTGC